MTMGFCWFMLLYVYVCWFWHSFQYVVIRTQLIVMTSVDVVIYSCRSCASNLYVQLSAICISASYNDLIWCHQTISNVVVKGIPSNTCSLFQWFGSLVKWHLIPDVQILQTIKSQENKKRIGTWMDFFLIPILIFHPDWLKKSPPKKKPRHFCLPRLPSGSFDLALEKFTSFWHKAKHKRYLMSLKL